MFEFWKCCAGKYVKKITFSNFYAIARISQYSNE